MEGPNKFNSSAANYSSSKTHRNVTIGIVASIDDDQGLNRIKVAINGSASKGGDNGVAIADLPWCYPMQPKFFTSTPKVGESVFIFTFDTDKQHSDRLYLGPIISQPQNLNYDARTTTSLSGFQIGTYAPNVNIDNIPALNGVFPNPEDISIQGRYNTDIILKKNEVLLRSGKFVESTPNANNPFSISFNDKTQGYIQIKNGVILKKGDASTPNEIGTVTNIISSKINLLTHKDGNPRFNLLNQDNLLSDDELTKILATAHPLPFGDIMLQYLRLLKNALLSHVHNGNGTVPTDLTSGNSQPVSQFVKAAENLERQMISANIKIN
jgi:hypothetical protein